MSDTADLIVACTSLAGAAGGALAFVWNRIEKSIKSIKAELGEHKQRLEECQRDHSIKRVVIELLWQVVERHAPDDPSLLRAKKLLDESKDRERETAP